MNTTEQTDFLALLRTLGQQQRLTMIALMSEREYTVTELAARLDLSEPTISHHVSKLHAARLLNLRMAGTQRFYRVNPKRLETFKAYAAAVDQPVVQVVKEASDNTWIDALDWEEEEKQVLRDYTFNGRIRQFPTKEKKWIVMLHWLATKFEADRRYTEKEVNAILTPIHEDYATLRRNLIAYGFMRRERGGQTYWLTPEDEA